MAKALSQLISSREIEKLGLRQAGTPKASWIGVNSVCDRDFHFHLREVYENAIRFEKDSKTKSEYEKATHFMHAKASDMNPGEIKSYAHAFVFYMPR